MEYIVETQHLVKKYGTNTVINDVSIHVKPGDIYGLIGKNGAGKTTLMRLLLGLANKTSGTILLYEKNEKEAPRKKIGSLIEAPALYSGESAYENLKRLAILTSTTDQRINEILKLVQMQ